MVTRRTLYGILLVGILLVAVAGMLLFRGGTFGGRLMVAGVPLSNYLQEKEPAIGTLRISGNSTDIVYPELMEAEFTPQADGTWHVKASFVDDSAGYDEIEIYDREFFATTTEVGQINTALYDGLDGTYASNDTLSDLEYASMGFSVDILYTDRSWISMITMMDEKGHLILMSGTGTFYPNMVAGYILEPSSALDGLVEAIRTVFESHLG